MNHRLPLSILLIPLLLAPARGELGKRQVQEKRLYENVYAVCIGVDGQSRDDLIPPLRFAGNDARAVHGVFVERYGYDSQLITGPDATRDRILKAVKFAAGGAEDNDVVIVYFAGHGQTVTAVGAPPHERAGYLIAYDTEVDFTQPIADLTAVDAQAVAMTDVVRMVTGSRARHVLLILDCCFSGFAADLEIGARSISAGQRQALTDLLSEPTRQVFTAGTSEQKSLEIKQLEHGLFTYHLVKTLNESDQNIYSLLEAFAAVRGKVSAEAARGSGRMTPQLRHLRQSNGDWVFIDKAVSEDALVRYEAKPRDQTSKDEYESFTASARSAEQEKGTLEDDPQFAQQQQEYEQRAATGDPVAMAIMQYCYEHGVGVKKDEKAAFNWAAETHDYDGQDSKLGAALLAHSYREGVGVEKNPAQARSLEEAFGLVTGELISSSLTGRSMTSEQKANAAVTLVQGLGSVFDAGSSGKASQIGKYRRELRDAAAKSDAGKTRDKLGKLEGAVSKLRAMGRSPAEHKLAPPFAAKLVELCDRMDQPLADIRKWEKLGAFGKIEQELVKMDPAIDELDRLFVSP